VITIYKTENCAYCPQTIKYIENKGITPTVIDITHDTELARKVSEAVHSVQVPVVTTAQLDQLTSDNFYTGWNLRKLNKFIEETK
jgi:glutaredoxin